MQVRAAQDADLEAAAEVTVAAYAPFTHGPTDPYVDRLRDTASRARDADLWVASEQSAVAGCVTTCPPGSPWRELARDGEAEFRMLAVAPDAQGRGVGAALLSHVLDHSRASGCRSIVLSSLPAMHSAHRLYERHGFVRLPERDWSPLPDVHLIAFGRQL
ncbi:GNAT family N-acetyltransferase [Nocardioides acrostichi]|uniref:GNAT family N-acetyltransferase n=1 Tax=Nocardioides acrostichi TaxID=2784339 RepID=A0A930UU45_9ACTN|nr:GNAT family N-acetyltransferase [Nocardioides acrostichi]MBF4160878.1 GNAT family N-acetyltransferase [Nocardioides acrostichi]